MPHFDPLSGCSHLSIWEATIFSKQFLEAVHFLHTKGVAHRDLKPENVVINFSGHQLFVIDFHLAQRVDGRNDAEHGFIGTEGFTAPEIKADDWKERYYSLIDADLWATGNLLEYILLRCDEPKSPQLSTLWSIARKLMVETPSARPSIDEALGMLTASEAPRFKYVSDDG